ncbi:hypothetical protein BST92_01655 [Nonlabens arenilitoris]|uniref:Secretion system C-terminal sorting domain-containing protein n=1 Tax=Nonlabens arenilitoris TaxID=1217969 RepID=A0A2S7U8K7_9FLAO|nr:T9SS type A sorting domain-containing protein [Nonlabens arenilitoris]PQJ30714.1 hypothetical protein BST92_01655 [Nonlabens arenilitoris]
MKTSLLKASYFLGLIFFGLQIADAQYLGVPFGGSAPVTSTVPGNSIIIECENFDSSDSAGTDDGVNYNDNASTPPSGVVGTYNDKTSANLGNSAYRVNTEVDISDYTDGVSGAPVTAISQGQGQEYQMYTVTFAQDGNYTMALNYATGGTNKRQQLFLRRISDLSNVHTFLNNDILPATGNSFTFQDFVSPTDGTADITAGTYVIQSRIVVNGPNYNHIMITTNSVLSNDDVNSSTVAINNPIKDLMIVSGLNSNIEQIAVFDLLGKQVLTEQVSQNGSDTLNLDMSVLNSGLYIVRFEDENGNNFSRKVIKE